MHKQQTMKISNLAPKKLSSENQYSNNVCVLNNSFKHIHKNY